MSSSDLFKRSSFFYLILIFLFIIAAEASFCDKITMNDGRNVEGKIIKQDDFYIDMLVGGVEIKLEKSKILSIVKENETESDIKIGDDFFYSGKYKEALNEYRKIKLANPENKKIDEKIAETLKDYYEELTAPIDKIFEEKLPSMENIDKAIQTYENMLRDDFKGTSLEQTIKVKIAEAYTAQANNYLDKIRPAMATKSLQKALEYNPYSSSAHFVIGTLILKTGRKNIAKQEFQTALELDPDNKEAAKYMAMLKRYDTSKEQLTIPKITLPPITKEKINRELAMAEKRKLTPPKQDFVISKKYTDKHREIAFLLAGYNAGPFAVDIRKGDMSSWPETKDYVEKVFKYYDMPLKQTKYDSLIEEKAQKYGLDPKLIKAIVKQESDFNKNDNTKNHVGGARGLIQLVEEDWVDTTRRLRVDWKYIPDVYDPEKNLEVGCHYLRWLTKYHVSKWMEGDYEPYMPT